jgi:hypothetical protein
MLVEELQPHDYKIMVDMDGVLMDFVKGVNRLLDKEYSDEKYNSNPKYKKEMWDAVNEYSEKGGELWFELDLMSDAKELWEYVKKYEPEILTSCGGDAGARKQKPRSIEKHFGKGIKVNIVERSPLKGDYATPNSILIDDNKKSIEPWKAAGGIGILHTSAANTIKELKKLGL